MTPHEIIIFGAGINLGVLLSLAFALLGDMADARRDQRAAEAQLQAILKREAVRNWRSALSQPKEAR